MKVLLLEHPRTFNPERCNDIANTPLSSCLMSGYAAAMLESEGHEVDVIEGYLDGLSYGEVKDKVEAFAPDILGVHMVYHWKLDKDLMDFLDLIKSNKSIKLITAFGFYPTIAYKEIVRDFSSVDTVVLGEHEETLAELVKAVAAGDDPQSVKGIAFLRGDDVVFERRDLIRDLDAMPFPVRTKALMRLDEVNILGSRGCYGGCTFCYINPFYDAKGTKWRPRSPENIMLEIDEIMETHGKKAFYFTDPNFFGPGKKGQERALEIAALLKERDLTFGIEGRVNDIHDETIEPLVEAGLRHILVGLESGRDASLKRMNKMTTVAQNERALDVLRRHGIEPNVGFIMFEPDSTVSDIRENFEFLKRNELLKNLSITANMLYHHQIVLRGTSSYAELKASGRLEPAASPYEGIASFDHKDVAALAHMMRDITNFLFGQMDSIWSGKVMASPGAKDKHIKVNKMMVDAFEEALSSLENGNGMSPEQASKRAKEISLSIKSALA